MAVAAWKVCNGIELGIEKSALLAGKVCTGIELGRKKSAVAVVAVGKVCISIQQPEQRKLEMVAMENLHLYKSNAITESLICLLKCVSLF